MTVVAVKRLVNEPFHFFFLFINFCPKWFQSAGGCIVVETAPSRTVSSPAPSITADHKT